MGVNTPAADRYCLLPTGTADCYCRLSSHQSHFNTFFPDDLNVVARCIAVSDDMVHLVEVANLSESPFTELGGVSQHYHLLCRPDHILVQVCFCNVAGGQAVVKIKAVNADEELVAHHFGQEAFRIWTDNRSRTLSQ